MQQRRIGERYVSAIGLGGMPMSRDGRGDEAQSIATVLAALDAGITFIDTANSYHLAGEQPGHNERIIGKALREAGAAADRVLVATKAGRYQTSAGEFASEGRPEQIRAAFEASLKALGVDRIGLYQFHRPDVDVPYAESIGAFRDLLDEGLVEMVGISNANAEQIDVANEVLGGRLASVQNRFSPVAREEMSILKKTAAEDIAFLAYSPLGGIAAARSGQLGDDTGAFERVAAERGVSPFQVALAWELAQSPTVIPIPGASRAATIVDSAKAADLVLSAEELALLNA
ncbi:MAG: aldo/keto reductase [Promicromonosporaceae bacterium]|nr:aldo/keto reductase [Promicromonosporaceae bacterium]